MTLGTAAQKYMMKLGDQQQLLLRLTPGQFDKFVNAQIALWKGVIDKEGLKLDVN